MKSFDLIGILPSSLSELSIQTVPKKAPDAIREGARTAPGFSLIRAYSDAAPRIADASLSLSLIPLSLRVLIILSDPGYDPFDLCPSTVSDSLSRATIDENHEAIFGRDVED